MKKQNKVRILFILNSGKVEIISDHPKKLTKKQLKETERISEELSDLFGLNKHNK